VTLVDVTKPPTDDDYARLLAFRTRLREFQRWSQESAAALGLTAAQHQLLLAVRGHPGPQPPTMGDLASHLLVRHHTAVGLVDRAQALGLVTRLTDEGDHRVVRLALTGAGQDTLRSLSGQHLEELERLAPVLEALVREP
jgi:DNA-binding MarR family transcriptional regulator